MFCGNCGNQIQDQVANCPFCGCPVTAAPQAAVPQPAMQQMPVQPVPQQAVPQPAVQQVMPQQQTVPQAVPMQAAPQAAGVPMQAAAAPVVSLEPVCVSVLNPKNANKERIKLETAAMWYVEITNNLLIFSRKGGVASMMFGALGAIATNALCSRKPSLTFTPDQIRNMSYQKALGGQLLQIELTDGKLLDIKAKPDVESTIENWWRSQVQR
ncbi:MAG: hypothetical protein IKX68_00870 [Clostridiales bacterium]|nr:hypothetical protein [Clostridiales bacterium]